MLRRVLRAMKRVTTVLYLSAGYIVVYIAAVVAFSFNQKNRPWYAYIYEYDDVMTVMTGLFLLSILVPFALIFWYSPRQRHRRRMKRRKF
jgi:putative exporter of polyketide antibiotics